MRPAIDSAFTRGPSIPSIAGRNVSAKSTEQTTTIAAPRPIDRIAGNGKMTRPDRPIATATPEKRTALPAVPIAFSTACSTVRPRASSSRNLLTMKSE
jgi:hypothetical protein